MDEANEATTLPRPPLDVPTGQARDAILREWVAWRQPHCYLRRLVDRLDDRWVMTAHELNRAFGVTAAAPGGWWARAGFAVPTPVTAGGAGS